MRLNKANRGVPLLFGASGSGLPVLDRRNFAKALVSLIGTKRTWGDVRSLVADGGKADMTVTSADFRN